MLMVATGRPPPRGSAAGRFQVRASVSMVYELK